MLPDIEAGAPRSCAGSLSPWGPFPQLARRPDRDPQRRLRIARAGIISSVTSRRVGPGPGGADGIVGQALPRTFKVLRSEPADATLPSCHRLPRPGHARGERCHLGGGTAVSRLANSATVMASLSFSSSPATQSSETRAPIWECSAARALLSAARAGSVVLLSPCRAP